MRQPYNAVARWLGGFMTLGQNAAWATLGSVCNQGSTLASNIWIANLLGKSAFGQFVIVLTTVQATAAVAGLGLAYTATRYLSELRHRDLTRAGQLLGLLTRLSWGVALLAAAMLAAGAPGLADQALRSPGLQTALMLAAASTVFSIRTGFLTGALSGLEAFRQIGVSGLIAGSTYLLFTVGGAVLGGVPGAAIGLCAAAALQCAVLTVALHRETRRQQLGKGVASFASERPLLIRFAIPAALSGLSTVPVLWVVQAMLARTTEGFGNLAVYAAGLNLLSIVLFVPAVLNGVAMAWINRAQALGGEGAFRSALRTNVNLTMITATGALVMVAALGPTLLGLYGRDFRSGYGALALLLLAALPEALTNALSQSLQTRERMWEAVLAINLPRDLTILAVALLCIPRYGALGAAAGYLCGRLVALCSMLFLVRHEMSPPPVPVGAD